MQITEKIKSISEVARYNLVNKKHISQTWTYLLKTKYIEAIYLITKK